jgi:hypothetical protein
MQEQILYDLLKLLVGFYLLLLIAWTLDLERNLLLVVSLFLLVVWACSRLYGCVLAVLGI